MSKFKRRQVEQQADQQKELQNRADQFLAEYKQIRKRYQCDFQSYLNLINGGQGGIVPGMRVIDITKQLEAEKVKAEKEKSENKIDKR